MKKLLLPLLLSALLGACSAMNPITLTKFDATSQIVQEDNRVVAYFAGTVEDMEYSQEPVEDGFVRKLLGMTKDGRPVVQDFWAKNNQKQIDPVVLNSMEALTNPESIYIDGWVTYYRQDGTMSGRAYIEDGLVQGTRLLYYPDGSLYYEAQIKDNEEESVTYYYPNGKKAAAVNHNEESGMYTEAWDEDGHYVYSSDEEFAIFEKINGLYRGEEN